MKNLLLLLVSLSSLLLAQDINLLYNHKIPTFSYSQGYVEANDLLHWGSRRNGSQFYQSQVGANLAASTNFFSQSPEFTYSLEGRSYFDYGKTKFEQSGSTPSEYSTESSTFYINAGGAVNKYITHNRGLFVSGKGNITYFNSNFTSEVDRSGSDRSVSKTTLSTGIGYGRVINSRSVAKAYMLSSELGIQLADAKIEALSEILEKYESGSYQALYKDDSEIKFYKDVNTVLGIEGQDAKVRQILYSGKFKSINRAFGWEVELGLSNYILSVNSPQGSGVYSGDGKLENEIYTSALFAHPFDFNKQLKISLLYCDNLQNTIRRAAYFMASTSFEIEHSYKWASSLSLVYDAAIPEKGVELANFRAELTSSYDILSSLSISGSAVYFMNKQVADEVADYMQAFRVTYPENETTDFRISLKYYLF